MAGKSILVVDTPKTCKECRCQMMLVCVPADEDVDEYVNPNTTIPKWCPLRQLPSFKAVDLNDTRDVVMFCHGWNTCLAEITGETE